MVVVLVYFIYLAGLSLFVRVPGRRRLVVVGVSLLILGTLISVGMPHIVPLAYLLIGYWLPALLVQAPNTRVERSLLGIDRSLFGPDGLSRFASRGPRPIVEYLELAYLLCYAVVPAGFVCLLASGLAAETPRFWTVVLLASYFCYGLLPLLPTRAPRALELNPIPARSRIRRLNLAVLDRGSVQWNTFPSAHAAASVATALAVGSHLPVAGIVLMVIAISIAAGSVAGRYHYAADALTGIAVAVAAFVMASAVPAQ